MIQSTLILDPNNYIRFSIKSIFLEKVVWIFPKI